MLIEVYEAKITDCYKSLVRMGNWIKDRKSKKRFNGDECHYDDDDAVVNDIFLDLLVIDVVILTFFIVEKSEFWALSSACLRVGLKTETKGLSLVHYRIVETN